MRRGEGAAQRALFERLCAAARVIPARNVQLGCPLQTHEVDDLVQETLLALWRKLDTYDGRVRLETWAAGFAMLELLRWLRKARRFEDMLTRASARLEPLPAPRLQPDEIEGVHAAIADLDADESTVVRLKHFEDMPFESISRRLGESPSTIKSRYYRALSRLRARLLPIARDHVELGEGRS